MEAIEEISHEWMSCLSEVYTEEEADFMHQLLGNCSIPEQLYERFNMETKPASRPAYESTENTNTSYFPAQVPNANSIFFLQGSGPCAHGTKYIFPTTNAGNCSNNLGHVSIGFSLQGNDATLMNENTDQELGLDTGRENLTDMDLLAQKAHEILVSEPEKDNTRSVEKSGKKFRSSFEFEGPENKRNMKSKKNPKPASLRNTEEEASPDPQSQTLSSFCSDDDSKDSRALKLSGKSRSNRDPATDPQSAYARKRRERINERLRILQKLVPNGTKVDISTMLEEAAQYVKFLQLQIKLLSSDDLWMYAPIAYNGMNIGLELNINITKQPKKCLA